MILLRSVTFYLYLGLVTLVISLVLVLVGPFLSGEKRDRLGNTWGRAVIRGLGIICGLRYRVQGLERLSQPGNAVVLANHQSAWETIALRGLLPPNQSWVLKRELLSIPFFGWGLAMFRPIAIDRGNPNQALRQVLKQGVSALKEGKWMVVFPEGTRAAPGEERRYGASGAMLAKKSGIPVIPVAHNAGLFWRRNGLRKYPGTIEMVVGEPIDTSAKSAQEIMMVVEQWIRGELEKMPQGADSTPDS